MCEGQDQKYGSDGGWNLGHGKLGNVPVCSGQMHG